MLPTLTFIGHLETPYKTLNDCPNNIQHDGQTCEVVLDSNCAAGLSGLKHGQNVLLLYWFEGVDRSLLLQRAGNKPDKDPVGVFSLRSPHRPNPIAASVVPIQAINGDRVVVQGLDCLDGTKLIDIKPA